MFSPPSLFSLVLSFLDRFESKEHVQGFDRQQLEGGLGRETRPDGDESTPQRQDAILGDGLGGTIDESIVHAGIGRLIHELGAKHIPGGDRDRHEKARHE